MPFYDFCLRGINRIFTPPQGGLYVCMQDEALQYFHCIATCSSLHTSLLAVRMTMRVLSALSIRCQSLTKLLPSSNTLNSLKAFSS